MEATGAAVAVAAWPKDGGLAGGEYAGGGSLLGGGGLLVAGAGPRAPPNANGFEGLALSGADCAAGETGAAVESTDKLRVDEDEPEDDLVPGPEPACLFFRAFVLKK